MIKVETNCSSKMTDEEMRRVQGMGIEYLAANFVGEDACYDGIVRFQERAARYGLKISNAGCPQLQKCPSIHLGKPDRDEWIEKYNEFTRALGKAGVSVNYIAWQPNGIFRTKIGAGKYNHGQNSFLCDLDEIKEFPIVKDTTPNMMNPRLYTTSYNKPQGQQFDDTAVLSFIKLQYT